MRHRLCNKQLTQLTIVVAELAQQDAGSFPKRLSFPSLLKISTGSRRYIVHLRPIFFAAERSFAKKNSPLSANFQLFQQKTQLPADLCYFWRDYDSTRSKPVKFEPTNSSKNRFDDLNACRRKKRSEQT